MSGNNELISEYVDRAGIKSDTDFILAELNKVNDAFNKTNSVKIKLGGSQSSKDIDELAKSLQNLISIENEAAKVLLTQAKTRAELSKETLNEAKAQTELAKQQKITNQEKEKAQKLSAKEALIAAQASNDYLQLSKAYNEAALKAKNYALTLGESNPVTQEAIKQAKGMYDILLRVDQAVGQNQRNVGNYKSAFDGLTFSLTQVTRELPSLAISPQQFILAISNNLPILADEIRKAKTEIAALRAEGQQVPGLFGRLLSSFASFQVLFSVGVGLFTIFGKQISEFVINLFKSKEAIDEVRKSQELLNKAINEGSYAKAVENVSELRNEIELAKQGFLKKDEVVKHYNETIGKTTGQVNTLDEAEKQLNVNADAYIKFTLYKAAANLALEEAAKSALKAEQERLKSLNDFKNSFIDTRIVSFGSTSFNADEYEADKARVKAAQEQRKQAAIKAEEDAGQAQQDIAKKFLKQAAELSKQFNFNFFGDTDKTKKDKSDTEKDLQGFIEAEKLFNEQLAKQFLSIADNEKNSLDDRLTALQSYYALKEKVIDKDIEAQKSKKGITPGEIAKIEQEGYNNRIELLIAYQNKRNEINLKAATEEEKQKAKLFQDEQKRVEENFKNEQSASTAITQRKIDRLNVAYQTGIVNEKQYQDQLLIIKQDATKQEIQDQINYYNNLIELFKKYGVDTSSLEQKLAQAKSKYLQQEVDANRDAEKQKKQDAEKYANERQKIEEDLKNAKIQFAKDVFNAFKEFSLGNYENEKNKIQAEIDLVEEKKQKDIEAENQRTQSATDRAANIAVIEARAQAQKEQLEKRQRQIDQEKARFEKVFNGFQILSSAIQAVAKIKAEAAVLLANPITAPLAPIAFAQIPFVIASGAAQLAALAAVPIPKYRTGKNQFDKYEGLAVVGDGYKSELIVRKDGTMEITPSKPALTFVGKNDMILPDANKALSGTAENELNKVLAYRIQADNFKNTEITFEIKSMKRDIVGAIKNKKETHYHGPSMRDILFSDRNKWERYYNDNLRG